MAAGNNDGTQWYRVVCPNGNERIEVTKIWHSKLPDRSNVTYGIARKHYRRGIECEWSGHVFRAERLE